MGKSLTRKLGGTPSPHPEEARRAVSKGEGAAGAARGASFETGPSDPPQDEGGTFETGSKFGAIFLGALFLFFGPAMLRAGEEPVFTVTFKDGTVAPLRLEVPANRRFQLQLVNNGDTPAEFESVELRKEKVLAPKTTSILVFRTLDPGEYPFFDDFHPDAPQAVLIAK